MDFSFIIPCYNVALTIDRCLNSIYSQGLNEADFEVICVDDASTDPNSIASLKNYKYQGCRPANLHVIRNSVNKNTGGARNTGIKESKGDYLLFLDADDYYISGSLLKLQEAKRNNNELDFIMFDCIRELADGEEQSPYSNHNTSKIMSGREFFLNQIVPNEVWVHLYKRSCIKERELMFPENVYFEDVAFVIQFVSQSRKCRFVPITAYYYSANANENRATFLFKNYSKIEDLFTAANRIHDVYLKIVSTDPFLAKSILSHVIYYRKFYLRYIWKLPYSRLIYVLKEKRIPTTTGNTIVDFISNHPVLTANVLFSLKPLLTIAEYLFYMSKKMKRKQN